MLRYWTQKDAFLPLNLFDSKFYNFIYGKIDMIFNTIIGNGLVGWVYFIFFLLGLVLLFKIRKNLLVLVLPMLLHLALSAFKIYPFHSRLILYLIPLLLTIISFSIYFIIQYVKQLKPAVYLVVVILLFINGYGLASVIPFEKEEVKNCMDYISKDTEKYENIYLYCSTDPVFKFYQNNYGCFNKKINYIRGDWHRDDWNNHMMELSLIKGDTWMIFSEVYYNNGKSEAEFIINLLKSRGYSVIQSKKYFGATCYKVTNK